MRKLRRVSKYIRQRSAPYWRSVKPWILQDPEQLRLVFQTFEDLTTPRRQCVGKVESARNSESVYQNLLVRMDRSQLWRWRRMLDRVTRCWCVFDNLVCTNRLYAARCRETCLDLLGVQVAWKEINGSTPVRALIAQTIDHVRQMLIQHAQRPHHRG